MSAGRCRIGRCLAREFVNMQQQVSSVRPHKRNSGVVLLADHNKETRDHVHRLLEQHHEVIAVTDGEAAFVAALEREPDLVLSNVKMRPNGHSILERLRMDPKTSALPIILLSHQGDDIALEEFCAADDHLTMPFSGSELLARVKTQLELAKGRKIAEEMLRRHNEELEQRVRERTLELAEANEALRRSEQQLSTELEAAERLHQVSTQLIHADNIQALYEQILDTAVGALHADFGSMQLLTRERGAEGELRLLGFRGFTPRAAEFWEWVRPTSQCTCGMVLQTGHRVAVSDVLTCDFMVGSEDLATYKSTGIRAVQSTPLVSRHGALLGVFSTHWREPHELTASQERTLDLLARQAADLIERSQSEVRLAKDLAALTRIHALGAKVLGNGELQALLREIMDSAVAIMDAERGTLQLVDGKLLRTAASHGHQQAFLDFVASPESQALVCVDAMKFRERVIVPDIEMSSLLADTPALAVLRKAGVRAIQFTPMMSRDGVLLGVLTTQWSVPHSPDVHDLWRIDLLARLTADLIEHSRAKQEREQLLERERTLRVEAQSADRMKDEFLAIVSHELRTPLHAITGWAHLIEGGALTHTEREMAFQAIARNAREQTQMVEDLLDMSRIITGTMRLNLQLTDLSAVLDHAIESVTPAAAVRHISIDRFGNGAMLAADPTRLQQVFWNLLSNAVKFTPSRGRIMVMTQKSNAHVEVSVTDTGQGISPAFLPHVFERFRRGESSMSAEHMGLGLGLSIVKNIVELHGGTVRAESDGDGQGATFTVRLPSRP
jgi:signal transduction histidine kinase/DNA-binding response OmpR family regulator